MIDWATIKPGLRALLASLSGVPCTWTEDAADLGDALAQARCVLSVFGDVAEQSTALTSYVQAETGGFLSAPFLSRPWCAPKPYYERTTAMHSFTLRVLCESFAGGPQSSAHQILGRARGRLGFTSTRDALIAIGCGLGAVTPTLEIGGDGDREVSRAVFDLRLVTCSDAIDTSVEYTTIRKGSASYAP